MQTLTPSIHTLSNVAVPPADVAVSRAIAIGNCISRNLSWADCLQVAKTATQNSKINISAIHPASRKVAALVALLKPHQKPQGKDAAIAVARIDSTVRTILTIIKRSNTSIDGFLTRSLTRRVLAPLYFPRQDATWQELLDKVQIGALECLALCELNSQCDYELLPYLDAMVSQNRTIHEIIQNDFKIKLDSAVATINGQINLTCQPMKPNDAEQRAWWSLLWQWTNGDTTLDIPSSVQPPSISWKNLRLLDQEIVMLLADNPLISDRSSIGIDQDEHSSNVQRREFENEAGFQSFATQQQVDETQAIEIRTAQDPTLMESLSKKLDECRAIEGNLSVLQIRAVPINTTNGKLVTTDQAGQVNRSVLRLLLQKMPNQIETSFVNADSDLSILVTELERSELVKLCRDCLIDVEFPAVNSSRTSSTFGIVCGSATVSNPNRKFTIQQLLAAAERCLQGAVLQGRGGIKSLDVY